MFEQLKVFVGDNAEALKLIDTLEATTTSNVQTINDHEKTIKEIKDTRDKYKSGNALVKSVLGVDAVNEDTIKEAIKALKGGRSDEKSLAEIDNLKKLLKDATNENVAIAQSYQDRLQSMALDNALANAGLGANVANEAMYGIVSGLVREGATFENDVIVYKNQDGSTIYGNDKVPLTLESRISQLKSDDNYKGLFKVDVASGTGTPPRSGGGVNNIEHASATEMMKAGRK